MAVFRLTSSLLSPLGPSDWRPALGVQGEDAKAGGPETVSLSPSEARWGLGGFYLQAFRFYRADAAT